VYVFKVFLVFFYINGMTPVRSYVDQLCSHVFSKDSWH